MLLGLGLALLLGLRLGKGLALLLGLRLGKGLALLLGLLLWLNNVREVRVREVPKKIPKRSRDMVM